jgi:hypothetical protein
MIEGNFRDASLPGLLQFLATESSKLYRVKVTASGNSGEIYVDHGFIISAKYNLLDGEDAMCEFLSWRDGAFAVERLPSEFESTISKNLNLRLQGPTTFVAQSAFLVESNVGLNTVIVPSRKFGGLEWQDALRTQPLEREDFLVMAWIKEGRTMREACREFSIDIVKATAILYRLLLTHSVEPKRAFTDAELVDAPHGLAEEAFPIALSPENTSQEMSLLLQSAQKRPGKAAPVDLTNLKASMEAKLRSKEEIPQQKPRQEQISALPSAPNAGVAAGGQMAGGTSVSGQFESVAITSPVSALGAVLGAQAYASEKETNEEVQEEALKTSEGALGADQSEQALIIDCAPGPTATKGAKEEWSSSFRRTEAMPLVTIDIERLFQATFTATPFGQLALTNHTLDPHLRQTLHDVQAGKSLGRVLHEANRSPASILSTYRFCLARGYIVSVDPVIALTADLMLGRITLDQYLLQRRRINGDELRDLIEIEREKGIRLPDLLVRHGYLTRDDLERLLKEQKRFALK